MRRRRNQRRWKSHKNGSYNVEVGIVFKGIVTNLGNFTFWPRVRLEERYLPHVRMVNTFMKLQPGAG